MFLLSSLNFKLIKLFPFFTAYHTYKLLYHKASLILMLCDGGATPSKEYVKKFADEILMAAYKEPKNVLFFKTTHQTSKSKFTTK